MNTATFVCIDCDHEARLTGVMDNESPICPECDGEMLPEAFAR